MATPNAEKELLSTRVKKNLKEPAVFAKKCLQEPLVVLDEAKNKIENKVNEEVTNVKNILKKNLSSCPAAANAVRGVVKDVILNAPDALPKLAAGVVNASTTAVTGITKNFKSLTESAIDGITEITKAVQLISDKKDALENLSYPELAKTIEITSFHLKELAADPAFQKVLRDITSNYSDTLLNSLDAAQPAIDDLTDKGIQTVNKVTERVSGAFANTGVNMIKSFLAEIPVLGGIISLAVSSGTAIDKAVDACAPAVDYATDLFIPANATADELERLKCKFFELQAAVKPLYEKHASAPAPASASPPLVVKESKVGGGSQNKNNNKQQQLIKALRLQSLHTTKRLHNMWQHFCHGKRLNKTTRKKRQR